ncbi:MAG: hypothetical protein CVU38_17575 [Chloroflexi bacterium HGW-Chloroflexi-1]|nr:MAG: hypothetical protein CVU38_17575 [Chloroflexi bacterium HGW-Chloroflexi-1]
MPRAICRQHQVDLAAVADAHHRVGLDDVGVFAQAHPGLAFLQEAVAAGACDLVEIAVAPGVQLEG